MLVMNYSIAFDAAMRSSEQNRSLKIFLQRNHHLQFAYAKSKVQGLPCHNLLGIVSKTNGKIIKLKKIIKNSNRIEKKIHCHVI